MPPLWSASEKVGIDAFLRMQMAETGQGCWLNSCLLHPGGGRFSFCDYRVTHSAVYSSEPSGAITNPIPLPRSSIALCRKFCGNQKIDCCVAWSLDEHALVSKTGEQRRWIGWVRTDILALNIRR